jgi:hypothetical protein
MTLYADIAADDGLQGQHDVGADHHRVQREMRMRGMTALARDVDVPAIGCRQQRAALRHDVAHRDARLVVDGEHRVAREFLEQSVLDHHPGAATALFGGLEDKVDGPLEVPRLAEDFGGTQQHRGMAVVTAGMHAARAPRAVPEVVGLVHRQAVHVGPQPDRAHRVALAQSTHHAGLAEAPGHLDAPLLQFRRDDVGSPRFLEGELGMGMDIAADGGDLTLDLERTRQNRHQLPRLEWPAS